MTKGDTITYLMSKNENWNRGIFMTIDWTSIGTCVNKTAPQRVTNVLKMVHVWQHDGQQMDLFYENKEGH